MASALGHRDPLELPGQAVQAVTQLLVAHGRPVAGGSNLRPECGEPLD
jgi:hypothetical protein